MVLRLLALCGLVLALLPPCSADTITFKSGKKRTVRVYKLTREYVSYLYKGKILVASRRKVAKGGITFESKPLTEKELARALKRSREKLLEKLHREEKKSGIKTAKTVKTPKPRFVTARTKAAKGVKVIPKDESETKEVELRIDPFPDHPVAGEKSDKKLKKK